MSDATAEGRGRVSALDGPQAKLARAREHLELLKSEFDFWQGEIEVETSRDISRSQLIIRVSSLPELPFRWSTISGRCDSQLSLRAGPLGVAARPGEHPIRAEPADHCSISNRVRRERVVGPGLSGSANE